MNLIPIKQENFLKNVHYWKEPMKKYAILLGYFDKQWQLVEKLNDQLIAVDLSYYEYRYEFALKAQQFYTALEDLLKQIAKAFENHIQDITVSTNELLTRLHMQIPKIRPQVLSTESFLFLDKIRAFRHFIWHAYDCELLETELVDIQKRLKANFNILKKDFMAFRGFVEDLSNN